MSVVLCAHSARVRSCPKRKRRNATRRPSQPGIPSGGRHSKKAEADGRTIVWVDEAGFYLLPARVRTYAPRGQTPTLRVPLTRDHVSAIGALTADGRVLMQVQTEARRGPRVVRLLRHVLQQIPGKLL